jgi:hypothetical protein
MYNDCYPNYLYSSDSTILKIKNGATVNFLNLNDIESFIDMKNNPSTSFVRMNKITDLSYIKNMANNNL